MAREIDQDTDLTPVDRADTPDSPDGTAVETRPVSAAPVNADAPDTTVLRTTRSVRTARYDALAERYGGFSLGASFIGFCVATFFTLVFLAIVGAIVGTVGYQMGAPVPSTGHAVSGTTQNLGLGAVAGSLIALFLAYVIGGYTAGRMARFSGRENGLGVVLWTVIVAVILGIAGAALGSRFNLASQLHLNISASTLTTAGVVSLVIALIVMILGAWLGGLLGERYHRRIDNDPEVAG